MRGRFGPVITGAALTKESHLFIAHLFLTA
jgi:hypothetical protein